MAATGLLAQTFEVASIKPAAPDALGSRSRFTPGGRFTAVNITLKEMIATMWRVPEFQISGGPAWLGLTRYDISAKPENNPKDDEILPMIQSLLTDRFQLRFHRETKELACFVMVAAKGGLKFHESEIADGEPVVNPDKASMSVEVKGVPADRFVDMLSTLLHAPVINNTGLSGRYDAKVNISKYLPDGSGKEGSFDPISTILLGLQEELGLKLESKKMPLDLLIVDRAEKVPVEN